MTFLEDHILNSPSFQKNIKLLAIIKRGQQPLWEEKNHGILINLSPSQVQDYQKRGIENETSIAGFLDHTNYNIFSIRNAYASLLGELESFIEKNLDEMRNISAEALCYLINDGLNAGKGLLNNYTVGTTKTKGLASIISSALVQPSLIYLSSLCDQKYLDAWERTPCPICGNIPSVVVKNEAEVWRFKCTFCHTSYKMDIFSCPSCGVKDVSNFEFTIVGENHEYEIASCRNCSQYYKIINGTNLKQSIQEGMEGIYTEILDDLAHEKGLFRLDDLTIKEN
jgi:formate dehydrogenase maturation protein FdhE